MWASVRWRGNANAKDFGSNAMASRSWYLAGRHTRRIEIAGYGGDMKALGHKITSRWLDGVYEAQDNAALVDVWGQWALDDFNDIEAADGFVAFTETPGNIGRGGRHVEFGYALAQGYPVVVVGPIESMFYTSADRQYDTWEQFYRVLKAGAE